MSTTNFRQIVLKTAFCCMASDGEIDQREMALIKTLCSQSELFQNFDFQEEIKSFAFQINEKGKRFIQEYFEILQEANLSKQEELLLIDFAIKTINADEKIEYSEVKFFKNIRHRLKVSNEEILIVYPDIEDFLQEDVHFNIDKITVQYLENLNLPQFDIKDFHM